MSGKTPTTITSNNEETTSVKQLSDLLTVDNPADAFVNALHVIYSYNADDIQAMLDKLEMNTLKSIYNLLWERMTQVDLFNMKDSRPKTRQAKHTIIPDVYHFGMSLVNGLLSEEIRKVYIVKNNTHIDPDITQAIRTDELNNLVMAALMSMEHRLVDTIQMEQHHSYEAQQRQTEVTSSLRGHDQNPERTTAM